MSGGHDPDGDSPRRLHRHPRRRRSRVSPSGTGSIDRASRLFAAGYRVCLLIDAQFARRVGSGDVGLDEAQARHRIVLRSKIERSGGNMKMTVIKRLRVQGPQERPLSRRIRSWRTSASWPPSHGSMDANSSQSPSLPEAELTALLRVVDLNASCDRDHRSASPSLDFTSPRSPSAELSFEPRQSLLVRCREQASKNTINVLHQHLIQRSRDRSTLAGAHHPHESAHNARPQ